MISETLARLTALAAAHGASLEAYTHPIKWGTVLVVEWDNALGTGRGTVADMPKQALLHFRPDTERFSFAHTTANERLVWCLAEGLDEESAVSESQMTVGSIDEVENYLLGLPYIHTKGDARNELTRGPN